MAIVVSVPGDNLYEVFAGLELVGAFIITAGVSESGFLSVVVLEINTVSDATRLELYRCHHRAGCEAHLVHHVVLHVCLSGLAGHGGGRGRCCPVAHSRT